MTLPAKCKKCGQTLIDSLDIAVHLGFKSNIYFYSKKCSKGAREGDIGN